MRSAGPNNLGAAIAVCIFLAVIIWIVFGQTLQHGFINYDDNNYVYENAEVVRGLTVQGIIWAFTHFDAFNWHPLTWISHMLDCQLYGLNPGGHHFTNVLLHTAVAISLFLLLRRMTGCLWRSAFVAAVFAIHPLRVESVAWIAERKDLLSGLFFMWTIWAYVSYTQKQSKTQPPGGAVARFWTREYWAVVLLLALGLMCKPMLVTVPLVLLLLDYWPLKRIGMAGDSPGRFPIPPKLIIEKLPLLGLALASCVVTIFAQRGALRSFHHMPMPLRIENALISYATYILQMFWPSKLAVLYPLTAAKLQASRAVLSLVLLIGISTLAVVFRRRHRYLLAGWLWYLIMLIPVIGIVQVGIQARADRYTYLPEIGLYLMLTWAAVDLCAGWVQRRAALGGAAAVIVIALTIRARAEASYWRNSESLWTHTLACTSDNFDAEYNLACALVQEGKLEEAVVHYQKSVQINPNYDRSQLNLGNALLKTGNANEAIDHFQKALELRPRFPEAYVDLANAMLEVGRIREAMDNYRKALQIQPENAKAQMNLATVLATSPLASLRDGKQAVELAQHAIQSLGPDDPLALQILAAAYAEAGRFPEAVKTAQHALQLAEQQPNPARANFIRSQLALYRAGKPFHYPAQTR